jgi:hypothetical protein
MGRRRLAEIPVVPATLPTGKEVGEVHEFT